MNNRAVTMLAPPDFMRRVVIPSDLVAAKLRDGFIRCTNDHEATLQGELHKTTSQRHAGRAALIVASGPSAGIVPTELISDFAESRNCITWVTNNVHNVCNGDPLPFADYLVILDKHFWRKHQTELTQYVREHDTLPVFCFVPDSDIKYQRIAIELAELAEKNPPYRTNVYFNGQSSGIAAIQMAMHCGCNPIFLLGHDLCTYGKMTHGNGMRSKEELSKNYPQSKLMFAGYDLLALHAAKLGIDIYNISPISAITSFRRFCPWFTL